MTLKPEAYTDRVNRAVVRVEFRVTRSMLCTALAVKFWSPEERPARLTRAEAERALRSHLEDYGYYEVDAEEEPWEWADRQVARLWPDWTQFEEA
jgi:hypothetical protein